MSRRHRHVHTAPGGASQRQERARPRRTDGHRTHDRLARAHDCEWRWRRSSGTLLLLRCVFEQPAPEHGWWTRLRILYALVVACRYESSRACRAFVAWLRRPRPWDDQTMTSIGA